MSVASKASNSPGEKVIVGVVVLNWENFSATVACVESLLKLEYLEEHIQLHIVVCDNHSEDGSAENLKLWVRGLNCKSVEFLPTGVNGGYAYGNNRGIEFLTNNYSPRYIWILNNDVEVNPQSLQHLLDSASSRPDIYIWGSTLVDHQNRSIVQCGGGCRYFPLTSRIAGNYSGRTIDELITEENHQSNFDYVSGAAMFCRADIFEEYGLLTEDYFLYYEEHDFIKRIGGKKYISWCPESIVYHVEGLSTADSLQGQRSSLQQYYENLSTLKFTYRFYKRYLLSVLLFRLAIKPPLFVLRKEWHLFKPFFCALKDFYTWMKGQPKNPKHK